MQKLGKILIGLVAVFMLVNSAWAAEEQTPWQTGSGGWVMKNLNWPGYNAGYEFTPEVNGEVVKLGGMFKGGKNVRLYDAAGNVLAQVKVQGNNNWSYADIEAVAINAGESYTVAVETGWFGSSMSYGVGFPNFPERVEHVTIKRAVFGFGRSMPRWGLWGQMWGQADIVFVAGGSNGLPPEPVAVSGEFPSSPIYINAMFGIGDPLPTYVDVYLNIENISDTALQFDFPSSQRFDILLIDSFGAVVKKWSDDQLFLQVFETETLSPGEVMRVGGSFALDTAIHSADYVLRIELTTTNDGLPLFAQKEVSIKWAW